MQTNVLEYLEHTVTHRADCVAFSDGTLDITFGGLYDTSRRIASSLLHANLGTAPVPILMERGPLALCAFFGAIYAGRCFVPLDASMPEDRMRKIMESIGASCVICDAVNRRKAEALTPNLLDYEALVVGKPDAAALQSVRDKQIDIDPIYIVFTSGSTGTPKGVAACHRSVIDYAEALAEALPFDENTVFGNQTPLFFDAPLKEILPTLQYGAKTYLIPKKLFMMPVKLVEFLNEHRINTICWVVSAMTVVSSLGTFRTVKPAYLKTVCFGSEVFPRAQYDLWREILPDATFFNLYGPTEATGMSCYWRARPLEAEEPIPIGKPFRNTGILLLDADGKEVPAGTPGEICMRGTCVTLGYYNQPEKTAEAFVRNPLCTAYPEWIYKTGDMGYYNTRGELVFATRKDRQIKHMGHRIELGEIESAASECDGVGLVGCVYDTENKRIRLYYAGTAGEKAVADTLREKLPRYMLPATVMHLDEMPRTANGKLDRKTLENRKDN